MEIRDWKGDEVKGFENERKDDKLKFSWFKEREREDFSDLFSFSFFSPLKEGGKREEGNRLRGEVFF